MRRTLSIIQYIAIAVSVISLFITLFLVGDTDVGPEAPPPPATFGFAVLSGLGALVAV